MTSNREKFASLILKHYAFAILAFVAMAGMPARADVRMPTVFSDGMILQRNKYLNIWGEADPGETVGIRFGAQFQQAIADKDGKWKVKFPPVAVGGPFEMTIRGKNTIVIKDILVGDVWFCAGQSNMGYKLQLVEPTEKDIDDADYPKLRFYSPDSKLAETPQLGNHGKWVTCNAATVDKISAIEFFFGRELEKDLKIPIGCVDASYGGMILETWASKEALQGSNEFRPLLQKASEQINTYRSLVEAYNEKLATWKKESAEAKAAGKPEPPPPKPVSDLELSTAPTVAYNGIVAPVMPYTCKGMLWYQGENDTGGSGASSAYRRLFQIVMKNWRDQWGEANLPILLVQLPNFSIRNFKPADSYWAEFREMQMVLRHQPYVYVAVTVDTGKGNNIDIHPQWKKDIAHRLALIAKATQYKEAIPYAGPIYDSSEIVGDRMRIRFRFADRGLISKGVPIVGFTIAGDDKKFFIANAKIDGDSVVVWSDSVTKPVAVRYGWADNPSVNLYNVDKLPAAPFRTDTWPTKSAAKG